MCVIDVATAEEHQWYPQDGCRKQRLSYLHRRFHVPIYLNPETFHFPKPKKKRKNNRNYFVFMKCRWIDESVHGRWSSSAANALSSSRHWIKNLTWHCTNFPKLVLESNLKHPHRPSIISEFWSITSIVQEYNICVSNVHTPLTLTKVLYTRILAGVAFRLAAHMPLVTAT